MRPNEGVAEVSENFFIKKKVQNRDSVVRNFVAYHMFSIRTQNFLPLVFSNFHWNTRLWLTTLFICSVCRSVAKLCMCCSRSSAFSFFFFFFLLGIYIFSATLLLHQFPSKQAKFGSGRTFTALQAVAMLKIPRDNLAGSRERRGTQTCKPGKWIGLSYKTYGFCFARTADPTAYGCTANLQYFVKIQNVFRVLNALCKHVALRMHNDNREAAAPLGHFWVTVSTTNEIALQAEINFNKTYDLS